jgi:hypothetical protein
MHNVKLIRMQSGEDIMASMFEQEDSEQVQLNDPMRLVFRRMPTGQTVMMMMPWLPVELIKENSALVYTSDIVTVIDPKESMIRYYDKLVERTISDMADSDKMLDQLLEEQEEEENEGQQQEEMMQELLQHIQEVKNKKLH